MSEQVKYHEIGRPLVELAQQAGRWVMDKILPPQAVEFVQPELPFSAEGQEG